jgi:repressor LexA
MPGASRGLEITEFGLALIKEQHPAESVHAENADYSRASSHTKKHQDENISVPFLGKIAAGGPILTVEDRRTVDIPKLLKLQPSTYLLKVSGDSMINAQIAHGDWVIVDSAKIPEAKDIVVSVITEGPMEECTLKTYLPIGNGKIKLQPENPDYEPSIFSVTDIQIRGVVTSVLRTLG